MDFVEELLPDVMFRASDVPDTILRRAIQDGVFDFLRQSEVWRVTPEPIFTFEEVDAYEIFTHQDARIIRVHTVQVDNREIHTLDPHELDDPSETGCVISNDHPHQLLLAPQAPRGWYKLDVSLAPTRDQSTLPDYLVLDFRDALVAAALWRIYAMPGSGWFDQEVATLYGSTVQQEALRGKRLVHNRRKQRRRTVKYGGL